MKEDSQPDLNSIKVIGWSPIIVAYFFILVNIIYLFFLITNWDIITKFFSFFQNSTAILTFYSIKIINIFQYAEFTEIAILLAFVLGLLYLITSIENHGHMIFSKESKDINAQNVMIAILIPTLFNLFFIIPFSAYLISQGKIPEAILNIVLYVICAFFVLFFSEFAKLMHSYEKLSEYCKKIKPNRVIFPTNRTDCLLMLTQNKSQYKNYLIFLMIAFVILVYKMNYNLLTLAYGEFSLFFIMAIVLMLTFPGGPIKGPVNIHLSNGNTLKRVFIIEESNLGYLTTLHEEKTHYGENVVKKVMTPAVIFIESFIETKDEIKLS